MLWTRSSKFSYFETVLIALFFSSCVLAQSVLPEFNPNRPKPTYEKFDEKARVEWLQYVTYLKNLNDPGQMELEFNWVLSQFMDRKHSSTVKTYVEFLSVQRRQLPIEIRWLLAAIEIDYEMTHPETFDDALSALKYIETVERFSLSSLRNEVSNKLIYRKAGDKEDRFIGLRAMRDFVYLFRNWNRFPSLAEDLQIPTAVQKKRIQWLRNVRTLRLYFKDIVELVNDFDHPRMLTFSNESEKELFLDISIDLSKSLGLMYGNPLYNENGYMTYVLDGLGKVQYDRVLSLVKKWISQNLPYQIKNYDRLKRGHFVSADELLNRKLEGQELKDIVSFFTKKSVPVDSYLLTALMLLNHKEELSHDIIEQAYAVSAEVLMGASTQRTGVKLSIAGLEDQFLPANEYSHLLLVFYNLIGERRDLPQNLGLQMLNKKTFRSADMSEKRWIQYEWKRLQVLQKNLSADVMKKYLIKEVIGDGKALMVNRLIAAKYLRLQMNISNLDEISNQVKSHFQGYKIKQGVEVAHAVWEKNEGELVTLIRALHPTDEELQKFLSNIYAGRRLEGPIAGQTAIQHLTMAGIGTDEVREEILRKLQYPQAGDTAGTFRALVHLYPEEGMKIVEIIFNHRSAPEKLKLMLLGLIEEIEMNPELLASVKRGLEEQKDKSIPLALYQNLKLDAWLELQLERRRTTRAAPMCKDVASSPKR